MNESINQSINQSINNVIACKIVKACTDTIEIRAGQQGTSADSNNNCSDKTFAYNIET